MRSKWKEVVKTTAYHPFYVAEKGWTNAIQLAVGDELVTPDGIVEITQIKNQLHEDLIKTYNFHVEEWSSYFVSEQDVYVHNGWGDHGNLDELLDLKGHNKVDKRWKDHFENVDGFSKRNGVSGGHTVDAFNKYFDDSGLKYKEISKTKHSSVDGVYDIKYQVQAKDYRDNPIEAQYSKPIYKKTVIDTNEISMDTIESCVNEACKNGIKIPSTNNKTYFKGTANNGLKFEGWIDPNTEEFESLYPVLEWQK